MLKSKFFSVLAAVLLVLMALYLGRELYSKYQIDREIKNLESEIAALERENGEIARLIDYFQTDEYRERQARSLLNLQKPGEFAVAIPRSEEEQPETETETPAVTVSNVIKWWDYFFGEKL